MDVTVISDFISSCGFPMFVAIWMLYKTSSDSEQLKESVNELKTAITVLTENLKKEG